MITMKFIKEITVDDPDSNAPVEIIIYKLSTGGMVGIDSSFLSNTDEPVYSPYDFGELIEDEDDSNEYLRKE